MPPLSLRPYHCEDDFWRIRAFLREVFMLNQRVESSWQVARLDYWRWHVNDNIFHMPLEKVIYIWEDVGNQIVAVVNADGPDEAFFQVHPAYRTPELEAEMIQTAEAHLAAKADDGRQKLRLWAHVADPLRQSLLTERGYVKGAWPESQWMRPMDMPILDAPPTDGFVIRSLGEVDELPGRSWVSWRAFHPDEPDEKYQGWTWYHNIQRIPQYRRDLDLVAVAPDQTLVGFCTLWLDDVTRTATFEPVGIMPEYQGRGLGKALMCEGLRRIQKMGATLATVGGYSVEANTLYRRVMGDEHGLLERWEKTW